MLLAISPSTISKFSVKNEVRVLRASDSADFALAFAIMFENAGISIAAKIPITAITIINSTIVKARFNVYF